jgi:acyl-CoA synthetase (AMP-forming)/AMP-acid ligase II
VARGLGDAGLRPGEPVIIVPVQDGEVDTAVIVVGCLLAGCPPLVLPAVDGGLSANLGLLSRAAEITDCRALLSGARGASGLAATEALAEGAGVAASVLGLIDLQSGRARLGQSPRPNRVANCQALQLTSGTTGASRLCVWDASSMRDAMAGVAQATALSAGDVLFAWSGLHHSVGLFNNLIVGLFHQVPVVLMNTQAFASNPGLWLRGLDASAATITAAPNFALQQVADRVPDEDLRGLSLSNLRAIWNAGERVMPSSVAAMYDRLRANGLRREALRANYGLSETLGGATYSSTSAAPLLVETLDAGAIEEDGVARSWQGNGRSIEVATLGAPRPGLRVAILDDSGGERAEGEIGEIALATPSHFDRYLNDRAATEAAFRGDLMLTGDLGYLREGQLFWIGRSKDVINVRGRKIAPDEFTPILERIEGVDAMRFVAFGVVDPDKGTERIVVIAEISEADRKTAIVRALRRASATTLGVAVDEVITIAPGALQTTISGKRRHGHYRKLYLAGEIDPKDVI